MTEEQLKARAIQLIRDKLDNDFYFQLVETGTTEQDAEAINELVAGSTITLSFAGSSTKFVVQ